MISIYDTINNVWRYYVSQIELWLCNNWKLNCETLFCDKKINFLWHFLSAQNSCFSRSTTKLTIKEIRAQKKNKCSGNYKIFPNNFFITAAQESKLDLGSPQGSLNHFNVFLRNKSDCFTVMMKMNRMMKGSNLRANRTIATVFKKAI